MQRPIRPVAQWPERSQPGRFASLRSKKSIIVVYAVPVGWPVTAPSGCLHLPASTSRRRVGRDVTQQGQCNKEPPEHGDTVAVVGQHVDERGPRQEHEAEDRDEHVVVGAIGPSS